MRMALRELALYRLADEQLRQGGTNVDLPFFHFPHLLHSIPLVLSSSLAPHSCLPESLLLLLITEFASGRRSDVLLGLSTFIYVCWDAALRYQDGPMPDLGQCQAFCLCSNDHSW
jgi:hypothetical protein